MNKSNIPALLEPVATAWLPERAFLRVTGSDATRWLNGMVTNSVQALHPGEGNYNFLLNAQGRIQGDCIIYRNSAEPASFLLATSIDQAETIHQLLDRFIIMDDVELARTHEEESTLAVLGPEAPALLHALGLHFLDPLRLVSTRAFESDVLLTTPPSAGYAYQELTSSTAVIAEIKVNADKYGASLLTKEKMEELRIYSGIPRFGLDIRDRDLPQETNQSHALHFAKGCYLGQEIVERIRSRGQVHRLFTAFTLHGSLPDTPAVLEANGKGVGELTSAISTGEEILALGYARREALDLGQNLTYSGGNAVPRTIASQKSIQ